MRKGKLKKKAHKNRLAVHFSSKSDEWATPQPLFDLLNAKYGPFDLDVCANYTNAKCDIYFGEDQYGASTDGLAMDWHAKSFTGDIFKDTDAFGFRKAKGRRCWMNPPYSRGQQPKWIKKAYEESQKGCTVVALLPARTDTRAFHNYIWDRSNNAPKANVEIEFLKGRVKFGGAKNGAPFPSMVVIFRPGAKKS